jgi:phage N-6-adenine-methyltransferase
MNKYLTPIDKFNEWNSEFNFDLDPCCDCREEALTPDFITPEQNGLVQKWHGSVYCNPPYSEVEKWIMKAEKEVKDNCESVVMLLPSNTGMKWFKHVHENHEVRFIPGRLKFRGTKHNAPNYHVLVIIR